MLRRYAAGIDAFHVRPLGLALQLRSVGIEAQQFLRGEFALVRVGQ